MAHGILIGQKRKRGRETMEKKKVNNCKLQANKKKTIVFVFFSFLNCVENQKRSSLNLI